MHQHQHGQHHDSQQTIHYHHQQHQEQQRQEHQFVTDTDHWLGEDAQLQLLPNLVYRRAKRSIPDTEKDDKYWEKRQRNNMAAKRSRENKRLLENDIKHKVSYLEEQNALLRKEISLIKSRLGIPLEQCMLTREERAQCMLEVKKIQEARRAKQRKDSSHDDVSSTSQTFYPAGLQQIINDNDDDQRESSDSSDCSSKVKDASYSSRSPYEPTTYLPFNPSSSWGPTCSTTMSLSRSDWSKIHSPPAKDHTSIAFRNHSSKSSNLCINGTKISYCRPTCSLPYMQPTDHNPLLPCRGKNEINVTSGDCSVNCDYRQEHRIDPGSTEGNVLNLMRSDNRELFNTLSQNVDNSLDSALCSEDLANLATSLDQTLPKQKYYCRELEVLTQAVPSSITTCSLPTLATHINNIDTTYSQNVNSLKYLQRPRQDKGVVKFTVRALNGSSIL